ncbi:MAG: hypothetical protein K8I00_08850 [Candidatus Omnitrophica bacterium]|nr:hypothetical protein [Candidatus Omnitrophota bacterium]
MLKAMKEQLKTLAETDQEQFHTHLRAHVGKRATALLEDKLKEIIVLMPDLVSRVFFYWNRGDNTSEIKRMGGYLLTYLYTPEDFLSTKEWGLFGYLDDAYFVAKIFTQVIDEAEANKSRISGKDLKYYDQAKYLKKYVRGVIPKATAKIDQMVVELKNGNSKLYQELFS